MAASHTTTSAEADESSINHRFTTVNGNRVELWGQGHDLTARRLAAELSRDMTNLRHVEAATREDRAAVWLETPEDVRLQGFAAPDGWTITHLDQFQDGTLAVELTREDL